ATGRPERSTPPAWPSSMTHERMPSHSPWVDRPPGTPLIRRHGQIASQLHDSKYVPRTLQLMRRHATGPAPTLTRQRSVAKSPVRYGAGMSPERRHHDQIHPNLILAVLSLAGLAYAVLSSAVIPALPTFQHALHASETGVTWLLTGFLVSASVGTSIIGRLGDMYGKERLLFWTLIVLAAGTLLAAVSQSLPMLIVARVIQGAGGGIFPLAFSIARDEFPPDRVAGSIGLMSSILGIGAGGGLVVGALLDQQLGWHWLFWIPLAITLLAAWCTWRYIPESPVRSPGKVNWLAATLMSAGLSAVLIAIAQTTVWGWGSVRTIALFASGALLCA